MYLFYHQYLFDTIKWKKSTPRRDKPGMGPKETHYIAPLRPLWKPKDNPKNPGPRHPKSHGYWTNQAWAQKNPITLPPRPSIFGMEQINTRKIVFFVRSLKCYKIFLTDKNLWPLDFCHEYFIRKWHAPNKMGPWSISLKNLLLLCIFI